MSPHRRVAVTSPQTRLAHARRRHRTAWRPPTLDPAEVHEAVRVFHAQRSRAAVALGALSVLLLGLPVVLSLAPWLDHARVLGVPVSWVALVAVPFPAMVAIAHWHLRRAERVEDDSEPGTPGPGG
ncbi:hypothetical protein V5P93_002665 [Actinokineospora auranticolor]|uniref:DUF485 domain-containing protein n=1 Tax=Actinokineospora auranticolor TaxID=155976 RepID=A0A2S6GMC1_9PSEU|nr:hypothetical protein [Actinokineospora auranticolor]PPK66306.1 hypothetical protein CLV40_11010 [Actinokineospora auranticolor]